MNNEVEKELRNSRNSFELEGNVANISDVYINKNGKQMLRFDLAQNNNGNTQFVPILLRGELINSYGKKIQKGDWISVKGRIATYQKDVERDGKKYKDKAIDILGFEIIDKKYNKIYSADGQVHELSDKKEETQDMER